MWLLRFLLAAPILAVMAVPTFAFDERPRANSAIELTSRIDHWIEAALAARGIEPAPIASDAEFHRRVFLDLAGRIPTEAEVRAFLADKSSDRRAKLVETLLASPHYVRHMANSWQNVMAPLGGNTQNGFRAWLDTRVQQNAPYDVMVRDLLAAPTFNVAYGGAGYDVFNSMNLNPNIRNPNVLNPNVFVGKKLIINPKIRGKVDVLENIDVVLVAAQTKDASPGGFFFEANEYKPENLAASTARRFLGIRLECAQCHNHPFASWTRKQFWEFAAFFEGVQPPNVYINFTNGLNNFQQQQLVVFDGPVPVNGQPMIAQPVKRSITIPGTNKVVDARFPDGRSPEWKDNVDSRKALADWMTSPSNPYFARTGANRLWAHFFGVGIIDPVDDEPTDDNPISHPELLAELTAQFVANRYDVKHLIRAITASKAYQRSSVATSERQNDPRLFARMAVKGLTPEQLFDSLAQTTGFQDPNGHQPGVIVPNTPRGEFLRMFATQDKRTETQTSILQALTLMNGKIVTDATSLATNRKLAELIEGPATIDAKIESLYLSTLSRLPRPEETSRIRVYLDGQDDNRAALADAFWVLLNSSEFRFNH